MDPIIQPNLANSPLSHNDAHPSNDCLINLQPFPSPSPSVSDGADETLPPIPPALPLSPPLPEPDSPKKRTADQADFSDERFEVDCKRARNGEKALTPVSQTSSSAPTEEETTTSSGSPKKRTADQADFSNERFEVDCKRARNGEKALTPVSQTSSSASTEEDTKTTSGHPCTPKKPRLCREPVPLSDRKSQRHSNKDSPQVTDKKIRKEKVNIIKSEEQKEGLTESKQKRKIKRPEVLKKDVSKKEEFKNEVNGEGSRHTPRKIKRPEVFKKHVSKKDEFKNEVNEEQGPRQTPKKNRAVAEAEQRLRTKLYRGNSKIRKEAPAPSGVKAKLKGKYIDESTTETDDNVRLKNLASRREKVEKTLHQKVSKDISPKGRNAPVTPEPSLESEAKSAHVESKSGYVKRNGVVGLLNLGNTCFGNTIIQALCNTPGFRDLLMSSEYSWSGKKDRDSNHMRKAAAGAPVRRTRRAARMAEEKDKIPVPEDASLCSELGDLFHCMTYEKGDAVPSKRSVTSVSPHEFCDTVTALLPMFERHFQHDAQEFLQLALQRMSKELVLEKMGKFGLPGAIGEIVSEVSPIDTLFGGQCINTNRCNGCSYSTTNTANPEDFLCLGLGIPTTPEEQCAGGGRKSTRTKQVKSVPLESCLEHFASPELIHSPDEKCKARGDSDKAPFCSKCGSKEGITKTLKLSKCSQYLCVHLKRFQWSNGRPYKISTIVTPPMGELDIAPYMSEGCGAESTKYELHTVVVHEGERCDSGHYIAYTKKEDGAWWKINDDKASIVSPQEVASNQAYMLFFTRKDGKTNGGH